MFKTSVVCKKFPFLKTAIGPILLVGCVVGTGIRQVYMTDMIVTSCVHYALEHINCYTTIQATCFVFWKE